MKTSVNIAILVDIKESPSYKNPFRDEKNVGIYQSEKENSEH